MYKIAEFSSFCSLKVLLFKQCIATVWNTNQTELVVYVKCWFPILVFIRYCNANLPLKFCLSDEREHVQKKTFTKWVNSHLTRVGARVNELYKDLQDGRKLILLLEILSGEKIVSYFKLFIVLSCKS